MVNSLRVSTNEESEGKRRSSRIGIRRSEQKSRNPVLLPTAKSTGSFDFASLPLRMTQTAICEQSFHHVKGPQNDAKNRVCGKNRDGRTNAVVQSHESGRLQLSFNCWAVLFVGDPRMQRRHDR